MHFSSATIAAILSVATFLPSASAASACAGSSIALAAVPDEGDHVGRYVAYTASACQWNMGWGFGKGDRCGMTSHIECQGSAISKIKIKGKWHTCKPNPKSESCGKHKVQVCCKA